MTKRAIFGAVGVAALGATAAFYLFFLRAEPVQVAVVVDGVVVEEIRAPGSVSSRTEVEVAARVAGVVDRVLVDEGATVEAGQLLAALDDRELTSRAATARAAAASAQHNVGVAQAALEKGQAELALARDSFTRDESLFRAGDVTQATLDTRTSALRAAEAGEKSAVATVAVRREDARRAAEEAKLSETLASYAQITAPLGGLVTKRQVEPGSTVAPGGMLFRIVDDDIVCVQTRVDVSQMGRVAIGLPARIRLASGDDLTGSVERIAYEADPVTRDQEVRIKLDQPPAHLTLDEEAQVVVTLGEARGLVVPAGAIVAKEGSDAVLIAREGRAVEVPVGTGAIGQGNVQILEGLQAGDEVILQPENLRSGQRVRAVVAAE